MSLVKDIKDQFRMQDNALVKIILINVIVYVIDCLIWVISEFSPSKTLFPTVQYYQAAPSDLIGLLYKPWTVITYAFSHDTPNPLHIFFNMLGLYWFGGLIREFIGSRRLISIYVVGALSGVLLYVICYNFIPYYIERGPGILVGASASVLAAVVAAATLVPHYHFHLVFLGRVKITYIAAFYVLMSIIGTVQWNAGGNIAHIGGALSGYLFITLLKNGIDIGKPINATIDFIGSLFTKRPNVRMTFFNTTAPALDEHYTPNQQEIDTILDKISRSGYESLTKEEKQKLFKASQK